MQVLTGEGKAMARKGLPADNVEIVCLSQNKEILMIFRCIIIIIMLRGDVTT